MEQMIWHILGSDELGAMQDQFVEGPFRLIFRGTSLIVQIESPKTDRLLDQAEALARQYIEILGRLLAETLWLLTEEEFLNLPPWAGQNQTMASSGRTRGTQWGRDSRLAIRDARHGLISYDWPLKVCYDYMQNAATADEQFLPEIYKMVETMENCLGGEAKLRAKTGLEKEVKFLKRIANEEDRDERHAPKDQTPPRSLTGAERVYAHDCATRVLRKFEEHCRSEGLAG